MSPALWIAVAIGLCFVLFLAYTRQFKWLLKVGRNMVLGIIGILAANFALLQAGLSLAVGANLITALVVGVLGIPGFTMLYLAQLLVG